MGPATFDCELMGALVELLRHFHGTIGRTSNRHESGGDFLGGDGHDPKKRKGPAQGGA
jgi:hypothetical protein